MSKRYLFFVLLVIPFFLFAQKKKKDQYVVHDISGIIIDAGFDDWKSNLNSIKSDLWSFGVSHDKTKIYAAVIIKDKLLIAEAIRNGILFNISYSDKKTDGARIIYPKVNLEKLENILGVEGHEREGIIHDEWIQSAKGYYVAGFDKVRDGLLAFNNQYGIKAACKIDESGYLVYESEIPLQLIKFKTSTIAVQLAVNTEFTNRQKILNSKAISHDSRGYYGGKNHTPSLKNPYAESTDVWFTAIMK